MNRWLEEKFHRLTRHRQEHILRVVDLMEKLAKIHGLPSDDAYLAGWGHDLARELSRAELLAEAERYGIAIDEWFRKEPVLLHGPVAARWLNEAQVGSLAVWEAIEHHTIAGVGLSPLAKALFIADGVEPGRHFAARAALEQAAYASLDDAYRKVLDETMTYLTSRGLEPHPNMINALKDSGGNTWTKH